MSDVFLSLADRVYLVKGDAAAALYDLRERRVWSIPPVIVELLEQSANGQPFEMAIRRCLGEQVSPAARQTIRRFVQEHSVLRLTSSRPSRPEPPPLQRSTQPCRLMFEITGDCNLRCRQCYMSAAPGADGSSQPTLPTSRWIELMEEGRRIGFTALALSGGEPTVHPDLDLLLWSAKRFNYEPIALFSNLTLLDDPILTTLSQIAAEVHTTVYSADARIHDAMTGEPGSFARVSERLGSLLAAGVETFVAVPLMEQNLASVDEAVGLLLEMGVPRDHITSGCTLPLGRGADLPLLREALAGRTHVGQLRVEGSRLEVSTCWAGRLAVASNGDVFVCVSERQPLGNVAGDSLQAVVDSETVGRLWGITLDDVAGCRQCEFRYACFDCRAAAHLLSGDLLGRDVTCPYDPRRGFWQQEELRMDTKPKRKDDLVFEEVDDDLLVADFRQCQLHVLNPTAAAIWGMCDGEHSGSQIADALAEHFGVPSEAVRRDVERMLGEFREKGLVESTSERESFELHSH